MKVKDTSKLRLDDSEPWNEVMPQFEEDEILSTSPNKVI